MAQLPVNNLCLPPLAGGVGGGYEAPGSPKTGSVVGPPLLLPGTPSPWVPSFLRPPSPSFTSHPPLHAGPHPAPFHRQGSQRLASSTSTPLPAPAPPAPPLPGLGPCPPPLPPHPARSSPYKLPAPSSAPATTLSVLPEDMQLEVLSRLGPQDLAICWQVCKAWLRLAREDWLWVGHTAAKGYLGHAIPYRRQQQAANRWTPTAGQGLMVGGFSGIRVLRAVLAHRLSAPLGGQGGGASSPRAFAGCSHTMPRSMQTGSMGATRSSACGEAGGMGREGMNMEGGGGPGQLCMLPACVQAE